MPLAQFGPGTMGDVRDLARFPRRSAEGALSYPLEGYELVRPPRGRKWVERQAGPGAWKRMSRVRRKGAGGKWLNLHPQRMCKHPAADGCQCPHYWHFSLGRTNVPYCRVLSWAFLPAHAVVARLSDADWCETGVTHHERTDRVSWKGTRLVVKDDSRIAGLKPKTRQAHGHLHN